MYRPARSVVAFVLAALVSSASVAVVATLASCAVSSPADLTPALDMSLPGLDAASDPAPAPPDPRSPVVDSSGLDSGSRSVPTLARGDAGDAGDAGDSVDAAPLPVAGELLVTEVMYDTLVPEPDGEWIEVYNAGPGPRALSGLTIKDGGGRTHVIGAGVAISPGEYVVLVRSRAGAATSKLPLAAIAYEYGAGMPANGGVRLANGATGAVALLNGPTVLASAPYGGWFTQSGGASAQLKVLDEAQASSKASWCLSLNAWTAGSERGTPGGPSDCP